MKKLLAVSFYMRSEQLSQAVSSYKLLGYDLSIFNPDFSAMLPENLSDFSSAYKQLLETSQKKSGINGSFTQGFFDLQASTAEPRGINNGIFDLNTRDDNRRIYSVFAGLPTDQYPIKFAETEIAFFDNVAEAESRAKELDSQKYLVYVSPVDELTIKSFSQLFYDRATGKKNTNLFIPGDAEKVKINFVKVSSYLPPFIGSAATQLQLPFEFNPRYGDSMFFFHGIR